MSDSEIITLPVPFHTHRFRDLKSFYLGFIYQHMRGDFPHRFSYKRFVEHQVQVVLRLLLLMVWKALCIQRYINQNLFKMLFVDNIHFLTKIEKNMNSSLMSLYEKILHRKHSVIEFLTPNSLYFISEKKTTKV